MIDKLKENTYIKNLMLAADPMPGFISGSWLKLIAVITMTIDHLAACIIYGMLVWHVLPFGMSFNKLYKIYEVMRAIGRQAFPIYCFLLVEGYLHTRDVRKYLLRLLAFGLVSELPFDRAFTGTWLDLYHQNVYFTLALGLLAVFLWDHLTQGDFLACAWWRKGAAPLSAAALAYAAEFCHTDYGWIGVAVIAAMYVFRKRGWLRFLASGAALLASNVLEAASFPDFLLFRFYNGTRGRQPKYFFYVFYPAHLALLALTRFLFIGY